MVLHMIYDERFQLQASAEANYLTVALGNDAVYDEIALRMLTEDKPDFFLPLSVKEINGRLTFRYKLINAVALKYAVDTAMTKKQYLRLASDLLIPFIKCKEWFLDYHYICIEPQYILRDKANGMFLYAYLPERSLRNTDEEIIAFVESVLNYIDISDDKEFQIRMMHYFRGGSVALSELYRMLMAERERVMDGAAPEPVNYQPVPPKTEPAKTAEPISGGIQQPQPPKAEPAPAQTPSSGAGSFIGSLINSNGSGSANANSGAEQPAAKEPEKKGFLEMLGISSQNKPAEKPAKNNDVLGGLFGGTASANTAQPASTPVNSTPASDSVMEGLFGSSSGKKPAKQEKASDPLGGLFGAKKEPAEKPSSGGGLFGMLGGQKAAEPKPAPAQQQPVQQQAAPQTAAAAGGYQPIGTSTPGADASPTFIGGGDRTMIDDLNAGAKYLELLDTQYADCPREISLIFDKPYLVVGRRSNDPVAPDIAFPEQYKGVSRQHARITKAPDGSLSVTDLGSTYGTVINGQRLVPNAVYPLTDGAVLTFVESKPIRYRVHL